MAEQEEPTGAYKAGAEVTLWAVVEVGGVHSTVIKARGNRTRPEGRVPALFMQPKSGGSGDCHDANTPGKDQDASEEALHQGQAGAGISILRLVRQALSNGHTGSRISTGPVEQRRVRHGRKNLRGHRSG